MQPRDHDPTPVTPIDAPAADVTERIAGPRVPVDDHLLERLRGVCAEVTLDDGARAEAGRDWWPLAIRWATRGAVPARPAVVARPGDAEQVAAVLAACHDARVPVTAVAGRSGVCGASVPVFGGVSLDLCGLSGVVDVDTTSLVAEVLPGTFGPDLEAELRARGTTLGHWPQSMDLSTVGGWVACRGAGQYSTRYGKIEDMVTGLEVALADGRVIRTGGTGPRAALGPDLTQLFVGSEGVLGVITEAQLRLHPVAPAEGRRAYAFTGFAEGLEVCRRILQRGATPAVLRLYDHTESARNFELADQCVLVVLDEADAAPARRHARHRRRRVRRGGGTDPRRGRRRAMGRAQERRLGPGAAVSRRDRGRHHRDRGAVVDAAPALRRLCVVAPRARGHPGGVGPPEPRLRRRRLSVLHLRRPHARAPSRPTGSTDPAVAPEDPEADAWAERYYTSAWRVVMDTVRAHGGAISHHHGVGINRGRFMADALGGAFDVLVGLKEALDPRGILNPGKLGLPSPFGEVLWP